MAVNIQVSIRDARILGRSSWFYHGNETREGGVAPEGEGYQWRLAFIAAGERDRLARPAIPLLAGLIAATGAMQFRRRQRVTG